MEKKKFYEILKSFGILKYTNKNFEKNIKHKTNIPNKEELISIPFREEFPLTNINKKEILDSEAFKIGIVTAQYSNALDINNDISINNSNLYEINNLELINEFILLKEKKELEYLEFSQKNNLEKNLEICQEPFCLNHSIPTFQYCSNHLIKDKNFNSQPFIKKCNFNECLNVQPSNNYLCNYHKTFLKN